MTSEIKDDMTHLLELTDTSLRFFTKEGASGHPTILCILNRFLLDKSVNNWYKNSGIEEDTVPKLKDNVHWYKTMDNKKNFKNSVFESILKYGVFFEENKDSVDLLNGCKFAFTTLNRKYFVKNNTLISTNLDGQDETTESINFNENIIDALSIGKTDYILTKRKIYSKTGSSTGLNSFKVFYELDENDVGDNNAMCSNYTNTIVLAGSYGGKLIRIEGGEISKTLDILYYSPPTGEGEIQTPLSLSNNLPSDNNCKFCLSDGDNFLIGDDKTYGKFPFSSDIFILSLDSGYGENDATYSGTVRHFGNIQYCKTSTGVKIDNKRYVTTFEANYYEKYKEDYYILYGKSGVEILPIEPSSNNNNSVSGGLGNSLLPGGLAGGLGGQLSGLLGLVAMEPLVDMTTVKDIDYAITIDDKFYLGSKNKIYTDCDPNKLRIYTFNMNFDKECNADKIDVGNIKLTFFELLDIGSKNSKVYDEKIGTLNGKPITYAIGISEKEGVTDYHLFGNDDRNRVAMEMKKCMEVFDMKA